MKVTKAELHGGYQMVFEFENGFGLSVVEHSFSYGLEAGLLKDRKLVYDGGKFMEVIGHLTESELIELIQWTSALPADHLTSKLP
jgi:hypothetical protein